MTEDAYLDNHSATKPFPSVIEQVAHFMKEYWADSTAPHFLGQQGSYPFHKSLESMYDLLGASRQDQLFLHGSGAEAINHVFLSAYFHVARETGKTQFLTSNVEEAPSLLSLKRLEQLGCTLKMLPVNSHGQLSRELVSSAITPRTALLSVSWANGLTGVMHPILDLAELCKEKGILFHVDVSYVFAKNYFRFQDIHAHFLTLNGAVLHGPKGAALTFVKNGTATSPLIVGKSNENVAMAVGLSQALSLSQSYFEHYCTETARLRDRLEKGICQGYPEARVLFQESERVPGCTAIAFPGVVSESLLYLLNTKGISASMGGGEHQTLAHMLIHCGVKEELAYSALSFSLSYETSEAEIDYAVEAITSCAKRLRSYSMYLI